MAAISSHAVSAEVGLLEKDMGAIAGGTQTKEFLKLVNVSGTNYVVWKNQTDEAKDILYPLEVTVYIYDEDSRAAEARPERESKPRVADRSYL